MTVADKLKSRKLWLSIAAFLGSVAASIAGIATDNEVVATAGVVCGVLSAAIYAAAEAYVDAASVSANVTTTTKAVTATASDKATVAAVMGAETKAVAE